MEERASSTLNVLVAVSAIYIVIFNSVPLTGYLNGVDKYIVAMYAIITLCVGSHQLSIRFLSKAGNTPTRLFAIRIVECFGRLFVIPLVIISFFEIFSDPYLYNGKVISYAFLFFFFVYILVRRHVVRELEYLLLVFKKKIWCGNTTGLRRVITY